MREVIQAIDLILGLVLRSTLAVQKYHQLKAENGGQPLTDEQIDELAAEADDSLADLPTNEH